MKQITETAIAAPFNVGSVSHTPSNTESTGNKPTFTHKPTTLLQLGHSRQDCLDYLASQGVDSVSFAHWLIIPELRVLLVFRQQRCVAIEHYDAGINLYETLPA